MKLAHVVEKRSAIEGVGVASKLVEVSTTQPGKIVHALSTALAQVHPDQFFAEGSEPRPGDAGLDPHPIHSFHESHGAQLIWGAQGANRS